MCYHSTVVVERRTMLRTFKRDLSSLEPLFEFAGDFARTHRLDDTIVFAMNLAIEELFTNMVKYGGGDDRVSVGLDVRDGDLVIELVHAGAIAFDPVATATVDVTRPLDERRPGGMGLHLVKCVMDDFRYEHRNGDARIIVTKHLGPRNEGA
ncbi:MAG: ATP-binding protein [Candidatus Latescibacteria bacterium]|nr:ATP-binding protein [Candidatus Latescibacterota bacterium]